ncbi:MAG TPA: 30S ribosomal protein S20 [Candidatus Dormibacteraeota bacterium]
MANTSSARKRIRSAARKHERNRRVRSSVRTAVVRARRVIDGTDEGTTEDLLKLAASALDKAGSKGILHARNVSRRKSRLMRSANRAVSGAATPAKTAKPAGKRASAQGTKPKAARAGAGARKPAAAPRAGRPATKTERTSSSQRRAAGSAGKDAKPS